MLLVSNFFFSVKIHVLKNTYQFSTVAMWLTSSITWWRWRANIICCYLLRLLSSWAWRVLKKIKLIDKTFSYVLKCMRYLSINNGEGILYIFRWAFSGLNKIYEKHAMWLLNSLVPKNQGWLKWLLPDVSTGGIVISKALSINHNFSFLNRLSLLLNQVATQLSSWGWLDPPVTIIPEEILGIADNRIRILLDDN